MILRVRDETGAVREVVALKGEKPVRGVDYWTAEDQSAIVADVLAALPAAEGVSV